MLLKECQLIIVFNNQFQLLSYSLSNWVGHAMHFSCLVVFINC